MAKIILIVAMLPNRGIGYEGDLPWKFGEIPSDMNRFKSLTKSHPVIMGRATWDSIPERNRPLKGRGPNIVISGDPGFEIFEDGARKMDAQSAKSFALDSKQDVFVVGGESIYKIFLPYADKIYLTEVIAPDLQADKFFPTITSNEWRETTRSTVVQSENDKYPMHFHEFERTQYGYTCSLKNAPAKEN